jgi:hypothetical protein
MAIGWQAVVVIAIIVFIVFIGWVGYDDSGIIEKLERQDLVRPLIMCSV